MSDERPPLPRLRCLRLMTPNVSSRSSDCQTVRAESPVDDEIVACEGQALTPSRETLANSIRTAFNDPSGIDWRRAHLIAELLMARRLP